MSKKLVAHSYTDKGAIKPLVRSAITEKVLSNLTAHLEDLGFELYEDEKALAIHYIDSDGKDVYATITLTVGAKAPNEKSKKTTKKSKDTEEIVID